MLVIGGGFAGLWATRALASAPVRITLVDRCNHHLFQPLALPGGYRRTFVTGYRRAACATSCASNATWKCDWLKSATSIRPASASRWTDGSALEFDYLLLSSGATHAYFGHDEWAKHAPGLKTLDDALQLRRHLLLAFERAEAEPDPELRAAWLSFAIVGGGPTGVELAGTLAEIARHTLKNEFRNINPSDARVRLIEAGSRVLSSFPEDLSEKARRQLEKLGVEVSTGVAVTDINESGYRLGEAFFPARTVVWAAGVAASPLAKSLDVPLDRAGRVPVQADLSVPGFPHVFVAGDLASLQQDGKPVPGVAPAAKQMGRHVAHVIRARLGAAAPVFRYRDFGNLATIGRMAAIVHFGKLKLSGLLAWWFWLAAHVFFLIGFRNRLIVLLNWAWAYWSYQRGARIILGQDDDDQNTLKSTGMTTAF